MPKLIANVHVADADGVVHAFGPGDDVPAWAVKAITNPKVWAKDDKADTAKEEPKRPVGRPPNNR